MTYLGEGTLSHLPLADIGGLACCYCLLFVYFKATCLFFYTKLILALEDLTDGGMSCLYKLGVYGTALLKESYLFESIDFYCFAEFEFLNLFDNLGVSLPFFIVGITIIGRA